MRGLRIILDKSAVFGLSNEEVDSLDRYFFQVVPQILISEIIADLTKPSQDFSSRIAAHAYKVSGNQGLAFDYRKRLIASLQGREAPMDGRFMASRERVVRTTSGSLATIIETPLEDESLARWECQQFTDAEKEWAKGFRMVAERPLAPESYLTRIENAGVPFSTPSSKDELAISVDRILSDIRMVTKLFEILETEFEVPSDVLKYAAERWRVEGPTSFADFAPYAWFCLKVNFVWHLSLTNPQLFIPDKNDRKDMEYGYYLPITQIFATRDSKQFSIMSLLKMADQSVVDADSLKQDLRRISDGWRELNDAERIATNAQRGSAPPENDDSLVHQLWLKHDGKLKPSVLGQVDKTGWVDSSLPTEAQTPFTLSEFAKRKYDEVFAGTPLSPDEVDKLSLLGVESDPISIVVFNSRVSPERLLKWYPNLTIDDIKTEIMNEIYLDPSEYANIVSTGQMIETKDGRD